MPKLYKITAPGQDDSKASYLFGTMHVSDPDITQLSPITEHALHNSKQVLLEIEDPTDAFTQESYLKEILASWINKNKTGPKLSDDKINIVIDLMAELEGKTLSAKERNLQFTLLRDLPPIYLIITLGNLVKAKGNDNLEVLDTVIANKAEELNIPIKGLELDVIHFNALLAASMDAKAQVEYIEGTVNFDDLKDSAATKLAFSQKAQATKEAYLSGDIDYARKQEDALIQKSAHPERVRQYYDMFLHARDRTMARNMKKPLDEGNAFAGIGFMHLKGVVAILQSLGYKIEPVTLRDEMVFKLSSYITLLKDKVLNATDDKIKFTSASNLLFKLEEIRSKLQSPEADLKNLGMEINAAITKARTDIGLTETPVMKDGKAVSNIGLFGKLKAKVRGDDVMSLKVFIKSFHDDEQFKSIMNKASIASSVDKEEKNQTHSLAGGPGRS